MQGCGHDSAGGGVPAPRSKAAWRVAAVEPRDGMRLVVTFADGASGEVRIKAFLEAPRVAGTIFEPLRDPAVFAQARIDLGSVVWPNGADLAPDAMYDAIRAHGHWEVAP